MNILFINLPYSGHIIPTIGLAQELHKRNNHVTYLLTEDWRDKILATGVNFISYKNDRKLSKQIENACVAAEKLIPKFDLIVYEQFFFLGKHLAEKYNKPVVRIFTSPASNDAIIQEYINAGGALHIFRSKWICRNWTRKVAKKFSLKTDCWLTEITQNPPEINLVYTIREFQPFAETFAENQFHFIGASIYHRVQNSDFVLPCADRPIVYISLGTVVNKSKLFYRKCIKAFEHENVTVIMSIGNSVNIDSFGTIPSNFYIYSSVPQLEVLSKADVFITHGGLNSVTEALYYAVPMVVIPFMTDQPINAKQIEKLQIGLTLNFKQLKSTQLRETTLSVLNDEILYKNVVNMQTKMHSVQGNQYGADLIVNYYNETRGMYNKGASSKNQKN